MSECQGAPDGVLQVAIARQTRVMEMRVFEEIRVLDTLVCRITDLTVPFLDGAQRSCCEGRVRNAVRPDLLVEERVVVDLKSAIRLEPVFAKQVLTYLRPLALPVGLMVNFGAPLLEQGVQRLVNDRSRNERVQCTFYDGDIDAH